ncbi:MAG: hypothetical protein JKY56_03620 [Kofleriaceae bacterium]|nr:hypothetical protein [Kofleriaceae bacterium]
MTTTSATPSFRFDLHTEALQEAGNRYVEVSCPDKGNSFRFYEVEYAVACGMDGTRDLGSLVKWAKSELDLDTTEAEVSAIVAQLTKLSYLSADSAASKHTSVTAQIDVALPDAPTTTPVAVQETPGLAAAGAFSPEPAAPIAAADVELGQSGKSTVQQPPSTPMSAGDVELGISGPSDSASPRGRSAVGMELGNSGNVDTAEVHDDVHMDAGVPEVSGEPGLPSKSVSTDLSQTFRIDQDEVKAAVRASQVMSAVTLPDDLIAELAAAEEKKAAAKAAEAAAVPEPVSAKDEISEQIASDVAEDANRAASESGGEAIVLPEDKPEKVTPIKEKPVAIVSSPEAKQPSASYGLWAVFLLVTIIGAGYYYMEFVREEPPKANQNAQPQVNNQPPNTPPAPVIPSATVKMAEAEVTEVVSDKSGTVGSMIEAGAEVETGDVLVTLAAAAKTEKAMAKNQASLDGYQGLLTKLQQGKNAAKTAKMQAKVTRKEGDVEKNLEALRAFQIVATSAGVVDLLVEAGSAVTTETPVAKITAPAKTLASFTMLETPTQAVGDEQKVVSKASTDVGATCVVTGIEGNVLSLECPGDLPADTEIIVAP